MFKKKTKKSQRKLALYGILKECDIQNKEMKRKLI